LEVIAEMAESENFWLYKEYPKTCATDDFWGQVKRTIKGKPVSHDQINMIVNAVIAALQFRREDVLLDLGCGNGALSRHFFPYIGGMLGVDFSTYLIGIAKANFEQPPSFRFIEDDIVSFVGKEGAPEIFTKALCYGTFAYLSHGGAKDLLEIMNQHFINIEMFFIGAIPDKEKIEEFYPSGTDYSALVDDNRSPIGIWRSRGEMQRLAAETGWVAEIRVMPTSFYAAHYRYDVLLRRDI
jgi:cyclopropane fatty-acyl-phospholipid synthase-like methyltransferase